MLCVCQMWVMRAYLNFTHSETERAAHVESGLMITTEFHTILSQLHTLRTWRMKQFVFFFHSFSSICVSLKLFWWIFFISTFVQCSPVHVGGVRCAICVCFNLAIRLCGCVCYEWRRDKKQNGTFYRRICIIVSIYENEMHFQFRIDAHISKCCRVIFFCVNCIRCSRGTQLIYYLLLYDRKWIFTQFHWCASSSQWRNSGQAKT